MLKNKKYISVEYKVKNATEKESLTLEEAKSQMEKIFQRRKLAKGDLQLLNDGFSLMRRPRSIPKKQITYKYNSIKQFLIIENYERSLLILEEMFCLMIRFMKEDEFQQVVILIKKSQPHNNIIKEGNQLEDNKVNGISHARQPEEIIYDSMTSKDATLRESVNSDKLNENLEDNEYESNNDKNGSTTSDENICSACSIEEIKYFFQNAEPNLENYISTLFISEIIPLNIENNNLNKLESNKMHEGSVYMYSERFSTSEDNRFEQCESEE